MFTGYNLLRYAFVYQHSLHIGIWNEYAVIKYRCHFPLQAFLPYKCCTPQGFSFFHIALCWQPIRLATVGALRLKHTGTFYLTGAHLIRDRIDITWKNLFLSHSPWRLSDAFIFFITIKESEFIWLLVDGAFAAAALYLHSYTPSHLQIRFICPHATVCVIWFIPTTSTMARGNAKKLNFMILDGTLRECQRCVRKKFFTNEMASFDTSEIVDNAKKQRLRFTRRSFLPLWMCPLCGAFASAWLHVSGNIRQCLWFWMVPGEWIQIAFWRLPAATSHKNIPEFRSIHMFLLYRFLARGTPNIYIYYYHYYWNRRPRFMADTHDKHFYRQINSDPLSSHNSWYTV